MDIDIFKIANTIAQNGGKLYLVGGAVRDKLLNINSKDKDYCVTGLTSDKFLSLFPCAHTRGKAFEVFDIEHIEFAIARTEEKRGQGHKGFDIKTGDNIGIEEDLARRDITINSMAIDVLTNELIDPFKGKEDLNKKTIRATTTAFAEDPLRVYRAARFAAEYEFEIEQGTINLMNSLKAELSTLSAERVFVEFKKALSTNKPSVFFENLRKAEVLEIHFKEIYDLIGSLQPEKFHPEGDSYTHTMIVVDYSTKLTNKPEYRFAALVHDLGKGITPKEKYPHHYDHDKLGVKLVHDLGNRLKMPTSWIKCGKISSSEHMRGGIFFKMRPSKKVEFIEKVSKSMLGLEGMRIVVEADKFSTRNNANNTVEFEEIGYRMLKEIDGKYIEEKYNIKPSIKFGELLHQERINWIKILTAPHLKYKIQVSDYNIRERDEDGK